ncbi:transporter substrate-binding domain-containing protein [uncultured Roseobacter sp.]|uniref:substrate-binding periplasmic protein n=1 Tax=uncultured Roseobacter sp. TaxID=114847 RepID=UPI002626F41A|nr:transporter substrate-binding domain-containing protein [uncultured Roseobacter sp.]
MKFILTTAIVFLFGVTTAGADVRSLMISSGQHPPFAGDALPEDGIVNSYVRRVAEEAGFVADIRYLPWARALETSRNANFQATSYWYYSEERNADFIHVGPVSQEAEVFFVLEDAGIPEWERLEDLSGYRIGATLSYTYTPEFWSLGESGVLTLSETPENESNLRKLLSGRIDLFPISEEVGWYMIRNLFSEEDQARFTTLKKPLNTHEGYLLVSRAAPQSEQIAADLQSAVDRLPMQ